MSLHLCGTVLKLSSPPTISFKKRFILKSFFIKIDTKINNYML